MRQSPALVSVLCLAALWSCGGQSEVDRAGSAGNAGAAGAAVANLEGFVCEQGRTSFTSSLIGFGPFTSCDPASGVECVPIGHACPGGLGSADGAGTSTHDAGGAGSAQAAEAGMGGSAGSAQAAEAGQAGQ